MSQSPVVGKPDIRGEIKELSLLFAISRILDESLDLRSVVEPILESMAHHMDMHRGTLTLLDRERHEILIDAAYGLTASERERGRYLLGEGITGKVVQSGEPFAVPKIAEEPMFLDRTGARQKLHRQEVSFICVPIKIGSDVIGTLSADRLFSNEDSIDEDVRLLSIIASMIGQAVRLRQAVLNERQALEAENERLQAQLKDRFQPSNIVGNSKKMRDVYDLIAQVAHSDTTVLLSGESGTGKELVAQAIHYNSPRSSQPFIKVSCAALPESVIESELFGHERGAFTGATTQRKGRFELAHRGTLFLDEIGDLSAHTQVKLLRVLQEREFERVGGVTTIKSDVRLIAATNRDLEAAIETGRFRADLYYRLNVFPIRLPPLRERRTDILLLADAFVERNNQKLGKQVRRISTAAIDMLVSYHWPGNVRELENCIERAMLLSNEGVIHGHHLPPSLQTAEASGTTVRGTLQERLDAVERALILDTLKSTRGNMAKAARQLGISERIMGLRVKKYDLDPRRFRTSM